jgi:hypothetical protein
MDESWSFYLFILLFNLNAGINIGVRFLYSTYSLPSRFTSSGSSIAFNSQKLNQIKSGVNRKTRETDLSRTPKPNSRMNTPVIIGFLAKANGPLVTSLGGGLKGTGVPLTLMNSKADHPIKNNPHKITGKDKLIFSGRRTSWGRFKKLSTNRAATTNSMANRPKKIAPMGVRRFRNFRLPVATLYKKSIHLVFKLTILSFSKKLFYLVKMQLAMFRSIQPKTLSKVFNG